jgi:hypothetical protein
MKIQMNFLLPSKLLKTAKELPDSRQKKGQGKILALD